MSLISLSKMLMTPYNIHNGFRIWDCGFRNPLIINPFRNLQSQIRNPLCILYGVISISKALSTQCSLRSNIQQRKPFFLFLPFRNFRIHFCFGNLYNAITKWFICTNRIRKLNCLNINIRL
jgi:hypothetical protein